MIKANLTEVILQPNATEEQRRQGFRTHRWCLITPEAGWGRELKLALLEGCIPIIISDTVQARACIPFKKPCIRIPCHGGDRMALLLGLAAGRCTCWSPAPGCCLRG